jgi:hypothetical protein
MTETLPLHLHFGKVRLAEEAVGLVGREEGEGLHDLVELVAEATILVERLRPLWNLTKAKMEGLSLGVQGMLAAGVAARQMFTTTLEMAHRVVERADSAASGCTVQGLPRLRQAAAEAHDWTKRVLDGWPRADQLLAPPNAQTVRPTGQAQAAGQEGEDIRDLLARVQAGGPLIKE